MTFDGQCKQWAKGCGPKRIHQNLRKLIIEARELKRYPVSLGWMREQPSGWVREVTAAGEADDARTARSMTQTGDVNKWADRE